MEKILRTNIVQKLNSNNMVWIKSNLLEVPWQKEDFQKIQFFNNPSRIVPLFGPEKQGNSYTYNCKNIKCFDTFILTPVELLLYQILRVTAALISRHMKALENLLLQILIPAIHLYSCPKSQIQHCKKQKRKLKISWVFSVTNFARSQRAGWLTVNKTGAGLLIVALNVNKRGWGNGKNMTGVIRR